MKLETLLWVSVTAYYAVLAVIYALVGGTSEGVVILVGAAAFGGLVAGWSWQWMRRNPARSSDVDGGVDDDPEIGIFPTSSLRPLGVAVGITATIVGVAVGSWMVAAGLALLSSQVALIVRDTDG